MKRLRFALALFALAVLNIVTCAVNDEQIGPRCDVMSNGVENCAP